MTWIKRLRKLEAITSNLTYSCINMICLLVVDDCYVGSYGKKATVLTWRRFSNAVANSTALLLVTNEACYALDADFALQKRRVFARGTIESEGIGFIDCASARRDSPREKGCENNSTAVAMYTPVI
ncbi:hypothetical protein ALC56_08300 [Trachymyrmex septentrionalis]|uniref:Uncharacterized protein n=1 Tax=Trachymyrmex septentrionalis TaxID=34720 RepID=A0A151JV93_9HYME|nr:hypothetical protein ALC56_08300 [Trachymyrmex septentrionalis]